LRKGFSGMAVAVRELHPVRGREYRLDDGVVIGRAVECDVAVDDPLVSRRHARVLVSDLGAALEDLDSSNGVYVNGVRRQGVTSVHPGDVIQLGGTWLRIEAIS
jgi:pSer/pThr/pTyr-binding forkhead associated (FHA) protein